MNRTLTKILILVMLSPVGAALADTTAFDVDPGRPMVQLMVNGQGPYPFVFDTGSPSLLVMQSLVDEIGLEVVGSDELQSPLEGTPVEVDVVRVESIALGGAVVGDLEASVLDMEGHGLGRGVVGPALFREHGALTLDFESNTVTLGGAAPSDVDTWLPFGVSAPLLDAPVRIGDTTIEGHLDTGNPGVLSVPNDFEDRLPLSGPVRTLGMARTVDAEFEIRGAPIETSARVGDAEIPLSQIMLSAIPVANLGTAGLRGLVLHVDWENERFALTGTADPGAGPHRAARQPTSEQGPRRMVREAGGEGPRFGLRAMPSPDGAIQVAGTEPGSPAEAIGLLAGDRIVALNGKSPQELEMGGVRAELARPDLVLTVEREGKTLELESPSEPGPVN
jgi:hypothetical protein